ncbi:MAG: hypothetical protein LBK73_16595 [Treponema sp.]|nr:hypothetical protein [Treponema sp.]
MVKSWNTVFATSDQRIGYPSEPHHPTGKRRSRGANYFGQGEELKPSDIAAALNRKPSGITGVIPRAVICSIR